MEKEILLKLSLILEIVTEIKVSSQLARTADLSKKNMVLNNATLGELLDISPSTIRRWVLSGKLKYTEVQGTRFYLLEEVLRFLGRNPQ